MSVTGQIVQAEVPPEAAGKRFDQILPALFPGHSRAYLAGAVRRGAIRLDGREVAPRVLVHGGEQVEWTRHDEPAVRAAPQPIGLDVVFEDADLIVLNKPAGLVVHPGAGNPDGTLLNALLHRDPELAKVPRAGLVHRLDKDTSGLLVVARSLRAHTALTAMLSARDVHRRYDAIVNGVPVAGGSIDAPLDRHPKDRLRRAVREGGRPAVTQNRVHMAHAGYPLVGDPLYGRGLKLPRGATPRLAEALRGFRRQALHAERLAFVHPVTGEALSFDAKPPGDFLDLLAALHEDAAQTGGDRD